MHIIFYGPEGSGKGTQAKLLSKKLDLPLLTSGDLVREAAQKDKGIIGEQARKALLEGRYVPDSEMFVLWKNRLKRDDALKGWIIDGFPRNLKQAMFLIEKIKKYGYKVDKVFHLSISEDETMKRLQKRQRKLFAGSNINHDDPQRIKGRLNEYNKNEKDLLEYFSKLGVLDSINGEDTVDNIHKNVVSKITQ